MASDKELNRMIYNVEGEIQRTMFRIQMIKSPFDAIGKDRDPHTGLSKTFLTLKSRHSLLIEISTKLHHQQFENYKKERSNI